MNEKKRKNYSNNIIYGRFSNMHITADKREIKDFPKLPLAISFIRKPLATKRKQRTTDLTKKINLTTKYKTGKLTDWNNKRFSFFGCLQMRKAVTRRQPKEQILLTIK